MQSGWGAQNFDSLELLFELKMQSMGINVFRDILRCLDNAQAWGIFSLFTFSFLIPLSNTMGTMTIECNNKGWVHAGF